MSGCKRGGQEKQKRTRSGRERGQWFSTFMSCAWLTTFSSVFQMSLLEMQEIGESTPQGVVLFLVGCEPENGKDQEQSRILRMYNLASLVSLARWAISQKVCRSTFIEIHCI